MAFRKARSGSVSTLGMAAEAARLGQFTGLAFEAGCAAVVLAAFAVASGNGVDEVAEVVTDFDGESGGLFR